MRESFSQKANRSCLPAHLTLSVQDSPRSLCSNHQFIYLRLYQQQVASHIYHSTPSKRCFSSCQECQQLRTSDNDILVRDLLRTSLRSIVFAISTSSVAQILILHAITAPRLHTLDYRPYTPPAYTHFDPWHQHPPTPFIAIVPYLALKPPTLLDYCTSPMGGLPRQRIVCFN